METTLPQPEVDRLTVDLIKALDLFTSQYPGDGTARQPVHVVYGGAHLFRSDASQKLGRLASAAMDRYAPDADAFGRVFDINDAGHSAKVYALVREKLGREPVEDLRIDFEDGYGIRTDDEEDGHAVSSAGELAKGLREGTLPPFIGIRTKALTQEANRRAIRTLDLFITTLLAESEGLLPDNFVVTLPKVVDPQQVSTLAAVLLGLETRLGLTSASLKMELMVETPQSIVSSDGSFALPALIAAAGGRCGGVHFGAYDFTASCGITSAHQDMLSPINDFARNVMKVGLAGTGVWLSDGATNVLPVPIHRGDDLTAEQGDVNQHAMEQAWSLHYRHCRNSLANGFYQGWDLHPAQLVSRYAAVYSFYIGGFGEASARLNNFVEHAARATMVGDVFDDAATGEGLLNYFSRALQCGAITLTEASQATGLTQDELALGSFRRILKSRGLAID